MKFTGLSELKAFCATLEANHQADMLEVAGETLVSLTRQRFTLGNDPYGKPWSVSRRAAAQGGQTLRDNGILANSFLWQRNGTDSIVYGTNIKYASTHQFGAVIVPRRKKSLRFNINGKAVFAKSATIPKRPMVPDERGDPPAYDLELQASLEAYLVSALTKAGG